MTMSDLWPKHKAIALVILLKNDQIWNWLILMDHWKVMKMRDFWPKSKAIALVFCSIMTNLKLIDFDWTLKSDDNERFLAKTSGYSLGILLYNWPHLNWLILMDHWKVMKMRDFWPKSKAIALVFCSKLIKLEIDWLWVEHRQVMKMSDFWPKSKAIALVFCSKMTNLKLIDFDGPLKSDENEGFLAKK